MLDTLLRHLIWADRRTAASLAAMSEPPAEAVRVWQHLLGAEATWLARIAGRPADIAIWPTLAPGEADLVMVRNHREFEALRADLAAHGEREVTYRNSRGDAFSNRLEEILHHVALHGMYHRGQVALEVRRGGGTPEATDLIAFLRLT